MAFTKFIYNLINWKNKSDSLTTPLGATNLNKMDSAIKTIGDNLNTAYDELSEGKLDKVAAQGMLADVTFNEKTGLFTFTKLDGSVFKADINIEKIPVSFSMSEDGTITMITEDGTEWSANIGDVITDYEFENGDTISFLVGYEWDESQYSVSQYGFCAPSNWASQENRNKTYLDRTTGILYASAYDGTNDFLVTHQLERIGNKRYVTANVKDGSITDDKLQPNYLAEVKSNASNAETSAQNASDYADDASYDAKLAQSYAIGRSGIREGEDADNAKYYMEKAKDYSQGSAENISYDNTASGAKATNVQDALDELDSSTQKQRYFHGGGITGQAGYVAFAQVKVINRYADSPIEFTVGRRGSRTPCRVSIRFSSVDNTDPSVEVLEFMGVDYGVFAHKIDTGTWLLYYKKSEAYDGINVYEVHHQSGLFEITYPNTFITEKPTENVVTATLGYSVEKAEKDIDGNKIPDTYFNKKTGDVINGHISQEREDEGALFHVFENSKRKISVELSADNVVGMYDHTNSKWIHKTDEDGKSSFHGNADSATNDADGNSIVDTYLRQDALMDSLADNSKEAQYNMLKDIDSTTDAMGDNTIFANIRSTFSSDYSTIYKRTGLNVWNYIKSKIESVLGIKGVANNLVTNDSSYALGAPQGVALDSRLTSVENALSEVAGGLRSFGSGVTYKDGYSSRIGVMCYATWTFNIESVTADTPILLGSVINQIRPLKLTALTACGVGGSDDKKKPCTAWVDNDHNIYLVPQFTDTGAAIVISGCWRLAT